MTDYNGIYNKLTKKELLYTLLARDVMLKDCRERFELHKNTDAKTIQDQSDLIEELKAKLAESETRIEELESQFAYECECNKQFVECQNENEMLKQQLAEKKKQIAELEEQLKNAIVPKFKVGKEVWWIDTRINSFNEQRYRIESYLIDSIVISNEQFRYYGDDGLWLGDNELFATKEEAQAKLKELQGE